MPQENVEIVRKPLRVRERSSRTLDQRLSLRFLRVQEYYDHAEALEAVGIKE